MSVGFLLRISKRTKRKEKAMKGSFRCRRASFYEWQENILFAAEDAARAHRWHHHAEAAEGSRSRKKVNQRQEHIAMDRRARRGCKDWEILAACGLDEDLPTGEEPTKDLGYEMLPTGELRVVGSTPTRSSDYETINAEYGEEVDAEEKGELEDWQKWIESAKEKDLEEWQKWIESTKSSSLKEGRLIMTSQKCVA